MIKFLKLLSDIVDPNYWANKISKKTGLEDGETIETISLSTGGDSSVYTI